MYLSDANKGAETGHVEEQTSASYIVTKAHVEAFVVLASSTFSGIFGMLVLHLLNSSHHASIRLDMLQFLKAQGVRMPRITLQISAGTTRAYICQMQVTSPESPVKTSEMETHPCKPAWAAMRSLHCSHLAS
jgi:hypothetical protein